MAASLSGFLFSLLTAAIVIAADFAIKIAAETGGRLWSLPMLAGCVLYLVSAILWFYAMRHMPLGQAAVAYSMFTLIGLCLVGVSVFDEQLGWRDMAGMGMAVGAMALMIR